MKKQIKTALMLLRFCFVEKGINWYDPIIKMDIERWKKILNINKQDKHAVAILCWKYPEFRNLLLYRHKKGLWKYWFKIWYKPMDTLYIYANKIGGGLFIQHGFATIISANIIGKNCWINQQVTIGYTNKDQPPIIGDNVTITCGAKVLGNINIGNNVVIGANAVVIRDVEEGAIVGGVPAHVLKSKNARFICSTDEFKKKR